MAKAKSQKSETLSASSAGTGLPYRKTIAFAAIGLTVIMLPMLLVAEEPDSGNVWQKLNRAMNTVQKSQPDMAYKVPTDRTVIRPAAWHAPEATDHMAVATDIPNQDEVVVPEALIQPDYRALNEPAFRLVQQVEPPAVAPLAPKAAPSVVPEAAPPAAPEVAPPAEPPVAPVVEPVRPAPKSAARAIAEEMIESVMEPDVTLKIEPPRSKIIRTKEPVTKVSVTDPQVLEIVQFSPTEFELIGGATGQTSLSFWFGDPQTGGKLIRYLVEVAPNEAVEDRRKIEYGVLERKINELFPNSMVQLIPVADKLIVRGQASDAEEATQIMAVIRGQGGNVVTDGQAGRVDIGAATVPFPGVSDLPPANVINMLRVTGEMQVMLKVRVAELTRSANREMGVDFIGGITGDFTWTSLLGMGGPVRAVLDTEDVLLIVEAIKTNSYGKVLAEPNLVTLSGRPANFLAGGEFAVPVVVGVEGAAAATTNFRAFGTQLTFTPTVLDRDRIRLQVAPSLSSVNEDLEVDGIPGLNSRAVSTTVDLREGQWLAIAGLLQDEQRGSNSRVPFIGDVPVLGTMFSHRTSDRDETELLVLVSPELIHPLEADEAPSILPGMEVTEPSDGAFFLGGRMEGNPYRHYRSTVAAEAWRQQFDARRAATKMEGGYQQTESYYIQGSTGFSE